ncbi:MAG: glycoside hydrolase family 25 protein [Bacteroidaceae bacterium]|nr:glycoside hydrolase family 25 protein [Bacteroidaceae bacterium]
MTKSKPTKKPTKRKRKKKSKETPTWLRNLLAIGMICVVGAAFYFLFVNPYSFRWKPCYGFKGYGVCLPCSYQVHGIDISHYQGKVDWSSLSQAQNDPEFPLRFVFLKATEGGDLIDDTFQQNFQSAKDFGFVRGVYHYFIPTTDARKQAQFFINQVKLQPGDLPPVLDVEVSPKRKDQQQFTQNVKTWLDVVEAYYGVKPILYASYKFREKYLNDTIFNRYPYWIAHYYVDSVQYQGRWDFWQHTDAGTVPGIKEQVDLDVFNGNLEELLQLTLSK